MAFRHRASERRHVWRRALALQLLLVVVATLLVHVSWSGCRQYGFSLLWMAPLGWAMFGVVLVGGLLTALTTAGPNAATEPEWMSLWSVGWASGLVGAVGWVWGITSARRWLVRAGMLGAAAYGGLAYGFLCVSMSA
ncbi:hypothetical protein [Variovorax sp. KK3]|uniref:hypothetical protein n=1 Tax=Variovorax sp. KK3 TaxID=1855728 RepID=UPI001180E78B|nr:hypothetical protein [Variovorax sp. KK3]